MQQAGTLPAMLSLAQMLGKSTDAGPCHEARNRALDQRHLAGKVGLCIAFSRAES